MVRFDVFGADERNRFMWHRLAVLGLQLAALSRMRLASSGQKRTSPQWFSRSLLRLGGIYGYLGYS